MSSLSRVKKLLSRQQCTGATKSEEIECFKKVVNIVLRDNIEEVDLDKVLRHLYNLGCTIIIEEKL